MGNIKALSFSPRSLPSHCLENSDEESLGLYISETADKLFVNAQT